MGIPQGRKLCIPISPFMDEFKIFVAAWFRD